MSFPRNTTPSDSYSAKRPLWTEQLCQHLTDEKLIINLKRTEGENIIDQSLDMKFQNLLSVKQKDGFFLFYFCLLPELVESTSMFSGEAIFTRELRRSLKG